MLFAPAGGRGLGMLSYKDKLKGLVLEKRDVLVVDGQYSMAGYHLW